MSRVPLNEDTTTTSRRLRLLVLAPIALVFAVLVSAATSQVDEGERRFQPDATADPVATTEAPTPTEQPQADEPTPSEAPTTQPPARRRSAPTTGSPAPTTEAPTTEAPTTETPLTEPTTSEVPITEPDSEESDRDDAATANQTARKGRPSQVQSSKIPVGSILLAVLVLIVIGVVARMIIWRQPDKPLADGDDTLEALPLTARPGEDPDPQLYVKTLAMLLELGRVLISSGIAVSMVETNLKRVAAHQGLDDLGAIVFPTALVLSVPFGGEVQTEAAAADTATLRLDQMDDISNLVRRLTHTAMTVEEANAELERIQRSEPPFTPKLRMFGYVLATIGLVLVLHGTWKELLVGGAVGGLVGVTLVTTRNVTGSWYLPFQPLVAALASSIAVFTAAHLISGFRVVPALIAPVVTMLPGSKLTMGVVELVTGHIVAGSARVASGAMQLVLLSLGIVAGAQLVGVSGGGLRVTESSSLIGMIAPWGGIAVFGIGVVWVNGALRSSRWWILAVMYLAYAGQVLGALFFGGALSSFFGAVVMTPFAVLASRQPSGPSPLVTFLPAFWILVPGALGLQGVSMLLGPLGANGASTLVTTLTSMIGVSLGVLLGLAFIGRDPSQTWFGDNMSVEEVAVDENASAA